MTDQWNMPHLLGVQGWKFEREGEIRRIRNPGGGCLTVSPNKLELAEPTAIGRPLTEDGFPPLILSLVDMLLEVLPPLLEPLMMHTSAEALPNGGEFPTDPPTEPCAKFGHHPDPAIDFCLEVEAIEDEITNVEAGGPKTFDLGPRVAAAMEFHVGGNVNTIVAKQTLRQIETDLEIDRQGPWRCYHCSELFTKRQEAALHFGRHEYDKPACGFDVEHIRWLEAQHRLSCEEDTAALRTISRIIGEHDTLRRRAEELGYERGLKDAKKYPGELGLQVIPPPSPQEAMLALKRKSPEAP